MAKRAASRQLTQDNWNDDDEEPETPGVYKSVDASVLQNRVIKKAKRTLPEAQEKLGQSPFSKFSGFGSKTGNSVPSLGFLMNICEKSVPQVANTDGPEGKPNGPNSLKSDLPEKNASSLTLKNSEESSHSAKDSPPIKKTLSRDVQYYRHLKALNESVLQWLQLHTEKNPWCDLTPVFNDYRKHINTIEQKFPLKEKQSVSPRVMKPFSFKVPSAPMQKVCNSAAEEKQGSGEPDSKVAKISSDDDDTESTAMLYGAGFKSSTTNTSTFSSGIKATTTATVPSSNSGPTSSCGSSEKEKTENDSPPFSFSFAKSSESSSLTKLSSKAETKPFAFAVSPVPSKDSENQQIKSGMNEDEEYVPPKAEVVNIKEEGSVYSKRCKLFYKHDGSYKEKGVGTLYLKPIDGKYQLLIRADTVVGNILLNIKLVSSLPIQRVGKNNVLVSCVPNPPIGPENSDAKEPVSFLIRTKTGDDADELFDMLNKYKS